MNNQEIAKSFKKTFSFEVLEDEIIVSMLQEVKQTVEECYKDTVSGLWIISEATADGGLQFIVRNSFEKNDEIGMEWNDFANLVEKVVNKHGYTAESFFSFNEDVIEEKGIVTGTREYVLSYLKDNRVLKIIDKE